MSIIAEVKPTNFFKLAAKNGKSEFYKEGEVFHSQDFPKRLFLLKSGYVKRYQATRFSDKVLELIYAPGYIISLSQLYKMLFGVDQNEENFIYVYQAMTDAEVITVDADFVVEELKNKPELYQDFFYESGLRLRSNIFRLASNSIKDDYQKVAHQIVGLAKEFAGLKEGDTRKSIKLPLPQSNSDIAEQLNISEEVTEAIINSFVKQKIIKCKDGTFEIVNVDLLKDIYLRDIDI